MSEIELPLEQHLNKHFVCVRNGTRKEVILHKVKRDKVSLQTPGRQDGFTISAADFLKFYKPL